MSKEQLDRAACLRETDKSFVLAITQPAPINDPVYKKLTTHNEGATFVREIDDGSDNGAQVFAWKKEGFGFKYGDRQDRFSDEMKNLCRAIGVVAFDPIISHVKDAQIPNPVPIDAS